MGLDLLRISGGSGSGNFGHEGRLGEIGGSGPGDVTGRAFSSEEGYAWHETGPVAAWARSLSDEDRKAIDSYTGFGYKDINNVLRGQMPMTDEIVRQATPEEMVQWRGEMMTSGRGLNTTIPLSNGQRIEYDQTQRTYGQPHEAHMVIKQDVVDQQRVQSALADAKKIDTLIAEKGYAITEPMVVHRYAYYRGTTEQDLKDAVGTVRQEKGLTSTMLGDAGGRLHFGPAAAKVDSFYARTNKVDYATAGDTSDGTAVRFDITLPKGTKVAAVEATRRVQGEAGRWDHLGPEHKNYRVESEVLLGSGAKFAVRAVEPGGDSKYSGYVSPTTRVKMTYVGGGSSEGSK